MLTTLCIIFATEGFYPKDFKGDSKTEMPLSVYTLFLSLFSASFGITKFFVKGPLPILPQDAPLAGVLSVKFCFLFFLNTMFVVRTFCLEASFFSSYRSYDSDSYDAGAEDIHPLIPEEYRLIIYLLPAFCSFLINLIRLAFSIKPTDFQYFKQYPQFLLCPMFCPLMFEGNPDQRDNDQPPVRVWKVGSILNSIFLGCIPQISLTCLDHFKGVPSWPFKKDLYADIIEIDEDYVNDYIFNDYGDYDTIDGYVEGQMAHNEFQDNNALLKYPFGNTIFSIATFSFYLFLMTIFFAWDKIFKDDGCLSKLCKPIFCSPFPNPCHKPKPEESDPAIVNNHEDPEQINEPAIRDSVESLQDIEGGEANAEVLID